MGKTTILFILLSALICNLYSQSKTIKGKMISESFDTLAGVSVRINGTVQVGMTDLNGYFKISIPDTIKRISLVGAGLEPVSIELTDKCDLVEAVVMTDITYDFKTIKKANKLRMKRFMKLPEIHKAAFKNGMFETESACYKREFPYYFQKDKK